MIKLSFQKGNAKLGKRIATLSLPAGHSCPFAKECFAKCNRQTGRITDGKFTKFRCYSASQEFLKNVRESRWRNLELLRKARTYRGMIQLIEDSLPKQDIIRLHVSGDFFSQTYFDAWVKVAKNHPKKIIYTYTKSLPYWINRFDAIKVVAPNLRLTASKGGKFDSLIEEYDLPFAQVVFSEYEARKLGLPIDKDDSLAMKADKSFALLIHGIQPKGSKAGKVWYRLQKSKKSGYRNNFFQIASFYAKKNKKQRIKK